MSEHADGRRSDPSPYSRTGLFPWGNSYEVPARRSGDAFVSQTPCHLTPTRLEVRRAEGPRRVHCVGCGRAWTVRLVADRPRPVAVWTA